jgi:hypothetical protein
MAPARYATQLSVVSELLPRVMRSFQTAQHRARPRRRSTGRQDRRLLNCALVTYDERILRFAADFGRQYGFAAVA